MTSIVDKAASPDKSRQLVIALSIYVIYVLLLLVVNVLFYIGERDGALETMEPIAGTLMMVAILVFSVVLPLWLARRWGLEYSFWPQRKSWLLGLAIIGLYVYLFIGPLLPQLLKSSISAFDFLIHFTSSMMLHIPYYLLFAVLLLPVIRKNYGLVVGLVTTSVLFALYHLAQFYHFPPGVTLNFQIRLFAAFLAYLLLYLWTENLILLMLAHNITACVDLAANGALFNQVDEPFFFTIVLIIGLFPYMIIQAVRHRGRLYRAGWWLQVEIAERGPELP